jgi:hypothetical protein
MGFAQIGPLTAAFQAIAAAIGAGIVLSGFAFGAVRLATGQPRWVLEKHVLTDGFIGGLAALAIALIDLILY